MTRLSCTSLWSVKCGILLFLFYFSLVSQPTDSAVGLYDAKIKLSRQSMIEIQKLLEGEDSWRTGALDNAISQILLDLKPHDYQAWKWRFEDTFYIELDTVLKVMLSSTANISVFVVNVPKFAFFPGQMFPVSMFQLGLGVLLIVAIINTSLWSRVAWCVQLRRLFAVCFLISIIWNWFYMYKVKKKLHFLFCCWCSIRTDRVATYSIYRSYQIAFADHQKNMVKLEGISEKCTGLKKYDWYDNLKGETLTLVWLDMVSHSPSCFKLITGDILDFWSII